jgi:hypothetical protein
MKKLYSSVAWIFVVLATPTIAQAANHVEHKNINYHDVFTSHPSWISLDSKESVFADKAIIQNAAPSHGSFQDVSEHQSTWLSLSSYFDDKNDFFGAHHESNHWNSWLAGNQHQGSGHGFYEHWCEENQWGHHGHRGHGDHGDHDWDDGPVTQPVPEPGTYMLMLLGLISLVLLKCRQH